MTKKSQQPNGGSADDAGNAQESMAAQPQAGGAQAQQETPQRTGAPNGAAPGGPGGGAPAPGAAPDVESAGTAPGVETAQGAEAPAERLALEAELATLRTQVAETNDKYLRLLAEFDNFKKRMRREHEEQLKYALLPLLKDITAPMDNLERALEHARQDNGEDAEGLCAGIELVLKQVADIFERYGMIRIKTAGEAFDPAVHEAMMLVESVDVPENQCIQEFQAGYVLRGRVVRPAMVSVSKRPPQPAGNGGQDSQD